VKRTTRITEAASDEFAAVRWYESQRLGLGAELFDAVVTTIARIEQQPEMVMAHAESPTRRTLVERFPYQIVYRLTQDAIVVVAAMTQGSEHLRCPLPAQFLQIPCTEGPVRRIVLSTRPPKSEVRRA
jgi:toxin ParE1/3/4